LIIPVSQHRQDPTCLQREKKYHEKRKTSLASFLCCWSIEAVCAKATLKQLSFFSAQGKRMKNSAGKFTLIINRKWVAKSKKYRRDEMTKGKIRRSKRKKEDKQWTVEKEMPARDRRGLKRGEKSKKLGELETNRKATQKI
jgi:hypothetical protein